MTKTKLKTMREKKGMSQSQLSKLTGIHYRTLQYYEQGRMNFDHAKMDKIVKAALALECGIEDIVNDEKMMETIVAYKKSIS